MRCPPSKRNPQISNILLHIWRICHPLPTSLIVTLRQFKIIHFSASSIDGVDFLSSISSVGHIFVGEAWGYLRCVLHWGAEVEYLHLVCSLQTDIFGVNRIHVLATWSSILRFLRVPFSDTFGQVTFGYIRHSFYHLHCINGPLISSKRSFKCSLKKVQDIIPTNSQTSVRTQFLNIAIIGNHLSLPKTNSKKPHSHGYIPR
jgi:hypothetical protein